MAVAAVERDVLPLTMQLRPKSILLDFMNVALAVRGRADLSRTAWFDIAERGARGGYDRTPRRCNLRAPRARREKGAARSSLLCVLLPLDAWLSFASARARHA